MDIKKISASLFLTAALFCFCKHEPVIDSLPIVSFSTAVKPIISGNCTQGGCHDSYGQPPLTLYSDLLKNDMVRPFDAYGSRLYISLCSQNKDEVMPRPPAAPLTDLQVRTIFIWITQGAKDN